MEEGVLAELLRLRSCDRGGDMEEGMPAERPPERCAREAQA